MTPATSADAIAVALAEELESWQTPHGAVMLADRAGVLGAAGRTQDDLPWASVTKIVAALAVLDVVAEGLLDLDAPAGPPGSTVRHLLGHASGLAFEGERTLAAPGTRRIYSNAGIDAAVDIAVAAAGAAGQEELLRLRVLAPLAMTRTTLIGSAAHGLHGPLDDMALLAGELLASSALRPGVVAAATTLSFPDLAGVLPGYGRQDPNDWGLGVELRGRKAPHWMPPSAAPDAFGHFGQSGSFLWVDPRRGLAAAALTGRAFGPWAVDAWPRSSERWMHNGESRGGRT